MTDREQTRRRLASISSELVTLDLRQRALRRERDELALALIEEHGLTWRETAALAGFENPYIAKLLREHQAEVRP